jgi:putative transposase
MNDWITRPHCWLSVERLPGCAPDLNPAEQVWASLKSKELANLCPNTIAEVDEVAEDGPDRISSDALLCFALLRHCSMRL